MTRRARQPVPKDLAANITAVRAHFQSLGTAALILSGAFRINLGIRPERLAGAENVDVQGFLHMHAGLVITAFNTSCRALIDFFYRPQNAWETDILAEDYFAAGAWQPAPDAYLIAKRTEIAQSIVHLTIAIPSHSGTYDIKKPVEHLGRLKNQFDAAGPTHTIGTDFNKLIRPMFVAA